MITLVKPSLLPPPDIALRVVLDTNVVMSFWHFRHPRMTGLLAWMEQRHASFFTRAASLDELAHVLAYADFEIAPARQVELIADYRARSVAFDEPTPTQREANRALPQCKDRDDQKFLELASDADAHLLLTRDKLLLAMAGRPPWNDHTQIITPERLLREIVRAA
jgi:uncharacterized protein